jgi:photosystem II stability/assembly factor-like uncharacterized protein
VSLNGTVWTPIGPSPISENSTQDNGLVTAIAVHPFNQNIIYIGTAAGGVWRTRDAGLTWTPLFDREPVLGIGEPAGIAIDPNNTNVIYVGSSERVAFGTGSPSQGIFKSVDAGNSWIQLGSGFPAGNTGNALATFAGSSINVIIVDPANGSILFCGTSNGVFRSDDGGQNWIAGRNAFGDARSLVLDSTSPPGNRILYAGISGRGAFTSQDNGGNWGAILSGATRRDPKRSGHPGDLRDDGGHDEPPASRGAGRSAGIVRQHQSGQQLDPGNRHRHADRDAGRL